MVSRGHCMVDLGDDIFTVGRPHPMIEPGLRCERILQEAADPETAVILLDFEIGYGSNADPVGVTLDAIRTAQTRCREAGRTVAFVGYVQGTDQDYQGLAEQNRALEEVGVLTAKSNLHAVTMALQIAVKKGAVGDV